jgi:hypothetical protein
MRIWKTLRDDKPSTRRRIIVLTTTNKIVHAWYNPENGKFYNRYGWIKRMTNYKRWCYEDELVQQALNEINSE